MSVPALLPQEIIYARKPMEDIRSSVVAIPVYLPNLSISKRTLKEILGYAIHVYRLKIPFQRNNLELNGFETRMLLHYIHRIATKLFDEKFPWKGKTNVSKKEVKKVYKEFQVHSQGKIQKTINEFFRFIQQNPIHNYPIRYQLSIENKPRLFNDYGYYYFTLSVGGTVEAETSLGNSASSIKQLTTPAISINRITTTDDRLRTVDSQVSSPESLMMDYYLERYGNLKLHLAFPWLKDFLLTYLSGVVQSVRPELLALQSEDRYQLSIQRSTKMETIQRTCKPNTSQFKDSLQSVRKELFYQSMKQSTCKSLSQLVQMILFNLDAIPMNRTERFLINTDISTTNLTEFPTSINNHTSAAKAKKSIGGDNDTNEKSFGSFLSQLDEYKGREELLCTSLSRKKLKIANLIAESGKLSFNRYNPIRTLRLKQEKYRRSKLRSSRADLLSSGFPGDKNEDSQVLMDQLYGVHSNRSSASSVLRDLSQQCMKSHDPPSSYLMNTIRELFCEKVSHRSDDLLENVFDSSALQAIAIFTEEAITEMLRLGIQIKQPLLFSPQSLSAEIFAQLNGSSNPEAIDPMFLRQRLEILFGRNLSEYQDLIHKKRQEFIQAFPREFFTPVSERQVRQEDFPLSLSSLNYQYILPENRSSISVREKEVEESDIKYPILSDAKRQLQGDKRTNYDGFPVYFFREEIERPINNRKRKRENYSVGEGESSTISDMLGFDENLIYVQTFDELDTEAEDD